MKLSKRILIAIGVILCIFSSSVMAQDTPDTPPAQFDWRDVNGVDYVTPVRQQGLFGTCWAHAAIGAAESSSIRKGGSPSVDLSEKALSWFAYHLNGSKQMPTDEYEGQEVVRFRTDWQYGPTSAIYSTGGAPNVAMSQMCTWLGASTEAQVPYTNSNNELNYVPGLGILASPYGDWELPNSAMYDNAYHMQECQVLYSFLFTGEPVLDWTTKAKEFLMDNGPVTLAYKAQQVGDPYWNPDTNSQYVPNAMGASHAVLIVGWDDNFPASNFKQNTPGTQTQTPPGDGAWIVKNSWGTQMQDQGYFYLSYYDQSINVLEGFDVETESSGYSYDKNNQYDYHNIKGQYYEHNAKTAAQNLNLASVPAENIKWANVFTSEGDETLKAVSATVIACGGAEITADVYLLNNGYTNPEDGQLVATAEATEENPGFYTLELNNPVALPAGTNYAVVEQITYTNATFTSEEENKYFDPPMGEMAAVNVEFGLEEPVINDMIDNRGNDVGILFELNTVTSEPGQSFVYGLNGTPGVTAPAWMDITSQEITDKLTFTVMVDGEQDGQTVPNTAYPGNVMIKAYTTYGIGDDVINPTSLQLAGPIEASYYQPEVYLSTVEGAKNNADISAVLEPANSTTNITWSISPSSVVSMTQNGNVVTVNALSEGQATLTATTGNGLVATKTIIVSNDELVCDGIDVISNTPDYITVALRNLRNNTARTDIQNKQSASRVSLFMWSEANQLDINAKLMTPIPGTKDWIFESIPVNQNAINNYFINADDININVYASTNPNSDGNLISVGQCQWFTPGYDNSASVAYVAYCQNTGFDTPTVLNGATSGNINDPYSTHMEGFRISSGLSGVEVVSQVYVQGLGWMPQVNDGSYVGTMGQDRPLESIKLSLNSYVPDLDKLVDFQYRVYIAGSGWTDWIERDQEAGVPGSGKAIQAMEVNLQPIDLTPTTPSN